jgi:hypothetical protein
MTINLRRRLDERNQALAPQTGDSSIRTMGPDNMPGGISRTMGPDNMPGGIRMTDMRQRMMDMRHRPGVTSTLSGPGVTAPGGPASGTGTITGLTPRPNLPPTPATPAATPAVPAATTAAPAAQAPATPPVASPTSQIGAEDNLIGTQFNPTDNPRLQAVQAQLDKALGGLEGPDRGQIARDLYAGIREDTADERQRGIRQISEKAGALGRIGQGKVSTELGDLEERLQGQQTRALRELSAGAAGQTLQDRLAALQGVGGVESFLSGEGRAKREELRGERGFQRDLSQDPIRQRLLEEQLLGGATDRFLRQGQVLAGAGGG